MLWRNSSQRQNLSQFIPVTVIKPSRFYLLVQWHEHILLEMFYILLHGHSNRFSSTPFYSLQTPTTSTLLDCGCFFLFQDLSGLHFFPLLSISLLKYWYLALCSSPVPLASFPVSYSLLSLLSHHLLPQIYICSSQNLVWKPRSCTIRFLHIHRVF